MFRYSFTRLPFFEAWLGFSGSIPDIYWNVWSEEQRYHWLCKQLAKLVEYSNELSAGINANSEAIEELAEELAKLKDPEFWDESFKKLVADWIADHLEYIFTETAKQVFFGLTYDPDDEKNSGYFCAYVPSSWSDIEFDTGAVYGQFDYGRLLLRFNADGSAVIDNTGRYDDTDINQLKFDVERLKRTLYTLLNQGGN